MTRTIPEGLRSFILSQELSQAEHDEVHRLRADIRETLQGRLPIDDVVLAGAYSRGTAVRPLTDVNAILVLSGAGRGLAPSMPPSRVLDDVKIVMAKCYPARRIGVDARSLKVGFGGETAFDVIPGFSLGSGVFVIPDDAAQSWIRVSPEAYRVRAAEANRWAGEKLRPLIRAVKHANNHHGKIARSLHLEVLAWQVMTENPGTFLDGLVLLLDGLARWVCERCPDPAGLGPDIEPSQDRCRAAQHWLVEMAGLARSARSLDIRARRREAHQVMRAVFGELWRVR